MMFTADVNTMLNTRQCGAWLDLRIQAFRTHWEGDMNRDDVRICTGCGTVARPKTETPGSMAIEVVLWLCLIVPGVVYSLWRISARRPVCAMCGSQALLPPDAPLAQQFVKMHNLQATVPKPRPPSVWAYEAGKALGRLFGRK